MKIKIEGEEGVESVERYVERMQESQNYYGGQLECAVDKADNTARALGRLCEVLMNKKVLTLDDLQTVAGGYKNIQGVTGLD